MPLKFRRLTRSEHLDEFRLGFKQHSTIDIPVEYFEAGEVTGLYGADNSLIGGYSLRSGPGIRWLDHIPVQTEFQQQTPSDRLLELNAVWIDHRYRRSFVSTLFWLYLGWDLGRRKDYIITFVVDPRKRSLVKLYEKAASGLIYQGHWIRSSLPEANLYWAHPSRFRFLLFPYLGDLLLRAIRRPSQ